MSVVASPACARTGGRKVKSATAQKALASPNNRRLQIQTTPAASRKKGRIPRRANVRVFVGELLYNRASPSFHTSSCAWFRTPARYGPKDRKTTRCGRRGKLC